MVPNDLRYTKEHEWVRIEGDLATVGITEYAAEQLGDIVFVELPDLGRSVTQFAAVGVIESVKAVSDLFAPVGGEVVETNAELADNARAAQQRSNGSGLDAADQGRRSRSGRSFARSRGLRGADFGGVRPALGL